MLSLNALSLASQKLQATDIPIALRVSYYLHISCSLLNSDQFRYRNLMQALYTTNPTWLDTCVVTPLGTLQSTHPTINQLLNPITALYQSIHFTQTNLPIAA